ncbi:LOW QUALITY PROTEIN: striatin-interacting protein 1 homolog [Pollicipes pollicipes]|uniref:LOW QUALITY PROTEIN: striatin-interacting protein 1 homolog n=1 Tax=Pollicipes pollicipes TaxID=41117 RepID=UPI00188522F8|nr:LOW QUALITY PROTEIN: striatin-interacting protein 1 homolog [Pollicipes pollicipes]
MSQNYIMDTNGNEGAGSGGGGIELGKRGLPKLREIMIRKREDSECGPADDVPELDFVYADADSAAREIAELYSFTELPEFGLNHQYLTDTVLELGLDVRWADMSDAQRTSVVMKLVDKVELARRDDRLKACRAILYVSQGCWADLATEPEVRAWSRRNVFLLYKCGVLPTLVDILQLEIESGTAPVTALRKLAVSLADSSDLRVILSVLYLMVEQMRTDGGDDTPEEARLRQAFAQELGQPQDNGELLAVTLLGMVSRFCSGAAPHFPMKKVLLVTWKVLLLTLGGSAELRRLRTTARAAAGLPDVPEDTVERTRTMRASSPVMAPADLFDPNPHRPRFTRSKVSNVDLQDELACKMAALDGAEPAPDDEAAPGAELDRSPPRCDSPRPATPVHHGRALPWKPKVHQRDIEEYLTVSREKFVGYPCGDDLETMAGLPQPILEGRSILDKHLYRSLAEVQTEREEEISQSPFSRPETDVPQTPAELLFSGMLPSLPQYMIALLKVLLAAAPTSKAKSDSINILADTLPEEMPMSVLHSMKLGIDVNRQKEVIAKAVSAVLLLLLKHFKLNHIYQFEFVSQHLVFANCIPLVLKFFNQDNIVQYVTAKNSILALDFPRCVLGPQPELTSESLQLGDEQPFCWRNVFTSINLLRILNKLCKWKHSRIMMLVAFKSAPILKKALRVKHAMMQVYTLKLLKMQTKYLGRQWRKSNMRTVSAIYQKVRHRLVDDWAFGNDSDFSRLCTYYRGEVDARPWDYEAEEGALRTKVDRFITRRYNPEHTAELEPLEPELELELEIEPTGREMELTAEFKANYRRWLETEVFQQSIDWDKLIEPGYMG